VITVTRADGTALELDEAEALDLHRQLRAALGLERQPVGALVSFGPAHARHRMLVQGDRAHCHDRSTQFEGGVYRMVAIADGEPEPSAHAPL